MKSSYPHPIIASEGWPFLAAAVAVALIVGHFWGWWSVPFWLVALFILQFFRDPPRNVPNDPDAVVSPADGRIVAVENSRDPYLDREALTAHETVMRLDVAQDAACYKPGHLYADDVRAAVGADPQRIAFVFERSLVECGIEELATIVPAFLHLAIHRAAV